MSDQDNVAGVVLAAGAGRRFGMPKALVPYQGELLVERAAGTLDQGGCAPVLVITGAADEQVRAQARLPGTTIVTNPDWPTGMGSSLRTALRAVEPLDIAAVVIIPVDMPGITAAAVRRVATYASPAALVTATYGGQRGHPVLLGRRHWAGITEVASGDVGARDYLRSAGPTLLACDDVSKGFDIDHPADMRDG